VLVSALLIPAGGAFADRPVFHHHDENNDNDSDHYSDSGEHPSKAERLGIVVQSRALLDKSGTTDFELTTGKLDSTATAPGNVDKLDIELVQPEGTPESQQREFEKEYHHLRGGGYVHYAYTGLLRNDVLAVDAAVSGFGRGRERTEIELRDTIKYRPDLVLQKLDFPATAAPSTLVHFTATVGERLGDLGAHTDCALFVEGKQVDQAKGIWIDAKGVVSCRFVYQFASAGTYTVTAKAQNVVPGDYDDSNNSMSGKIVVTSPTTLSYTAAVFESTSTSTTTTDYYYTASSTVPEQHVLDSYSTWMQGRSFSGQIAAPVSLPLKTLSYADSSDGSALTSLSYSNLSAAPSPSYNPTYPTLNLMCNWDAASGGMVILARYANDTTGAGLTTIDVSFTAGQVTYTGDSYCKSLAGVFQCYGGDWVSNPKTTAYAPWGVKVKLGATYTANVVVDDGTAYTAQPKISLVPRTITSNPPASCYPQNFGAPTVGKSCYQFTSTMVSRDGSVVQ
jgi:hypothetical protein